jgi:hypothetical protein
MNERTIMKVDAHRTAAVRVYEQWLRRMVQDCPDEAADPTAADADDPVHRLRLVWVRRYVEFKLLFGQGTEDQFREFGALGLGLLDIEDRMFFEDEVTVLDLLAVLSTAPVTDEEHPLKGDRRFETIERKLRYTLERGVYFEVAYFCETYWQQITATAEYILADQNEVELMLAGIRVGRILLWSDEDRWLNSEKINAGLESGPVWGRLPNT